MLPDHLNNYLFLALIRATASDPQFRNIKETIDLTAQGRDKVAFKDWFVLVVLAAIEAEKGNFEKAIACEIHCLYEELTRTILQSVPRFEPKMKGDKRL